MEASHDWLDEIEFPASKSDLIDAAVDHEAPQAMIEQLQRLDHERYESRDELEDALDDQD